MQCRWMELFQEFDFDIKYVKVKENMVVDALSMRRLASAISCIIMFLKHKIKIHYANDDFFKLPFESVSKEARTVDEIDKHKYFE